MGSDAAVAQELHAGSREPQQEVVVSVRDAAACLQGRPTDTAGTDPEETVTGRSRWCVHQSSAPPRLTLVPESWHQVSTVLDPLEARLLTVKPFSC